MQVIDSKPNCTGACETTMGCDCRPVHRAYQEQTTPDWVLGPTQPVDLDDNPYGETEQSMEAASWFAGLLLVAGLVMAAISTVVTIWGGDILNFMRAVLR